MRRAWCIVQADYSVAVCISRRPARAPPGYGSVGEIKEMVVMAAYRCERGQSLHRTTLHNLQPGPGHKQKRLFTVMWLELPLPTQD